MKELKNLTRKERALISIKCDSFFLTINKTKVVKSVFDYLKSISELPDKYDKELWMVVTAVGKALRSGANGTQIPLSKNKYPVANKKHGLKLNAERASYVLEVLDSKGLVEVYKGFRDLKTNTSLTTCVVPSSEFKQQYTPKILKTYKSNIDKTELVVITDSKTKQPLMKLTKFKGVNVQRQLMFDYNGVLGRNVITVKGQQCFVSYKQVFADDLNGAGRIYSFGGFQTLPSELRSSVEINGNKTTECDIKGMHCMIMYCLEGIKVPTDFDPYTIDNKILGVSEKVCRSFCKMGVMCLINCKSLYGASKALFNIWEDDKRTDNDFKDIKNCTEDLCKKVLKALLEHNSKLNFFPKGEKLWKILQRLDSKVMENIVNTFTKRDLVVLGWHDSAVCEREHQSLLIHTIRDSWFKVFGTKDNCIIDIEF